MTRSREPPEILERLKGHCDLHWLSDGSDVARHLVSLQPQVLCLDYDYPNAEGLALLRGLKGDHPAVAILMLTEYHSESLAVWAFRSRVWDYLVKPLSEEDLRGRIATIHQVRRNRLKGDARAPMQVVSAETDTTVERLRPGAGQKLVMMAKTYVQSHLSEDFDARAVARHCHTSYYHFSRTFKQVYGETFSEFLQKTRVSTAARLLAGAGSNVTQACYDAGFRDLSHFSRMFRRYMGVSPSEYRALHGRQSPQQRAI